MPTPHRRGLRFNRQSAPCGIVRGHNDRYADIRISCAPRSKTRYIVVRRVSGMISQIIVRPRAATLARPRKATLWPSLSLT